MKQHLFRLAQRLSRPFIRRWERVPLRLQGKLKIGLPLLAVMVSAVLALYGNYQRSRIEAAIQRHFQTVDGLDEMLTLTVNAETGMRGYLLTHDDQFLEPYTLAGQKLPDVLAQLRAVAESEPGEQVRARKLALLSRLQTALDSQMQDLEWQRGHAVMRGVNDPEINSHLAYGKGLMDDIRANLVAAQTTERQLLTERLQEINAIRRRDYLAIAITLLLGLLTRIIAWQLFDNGLLRRVRKLALNVRALRAGRHALPFPPPGKPDSLGLIEDEIAALYESSHKMSDVVIK